MDPLDVLLHDPDPIRRGRAHLDLARGALSAGRRDQAARHVHEALRLAPNTPDVVHAARALPVAQLPVTHAGRRSWLGWRKRRV